MGGLNRVHTGQDICGCGVEDGFGLQEEEEDEEEEEEEGGPGFGGEEGG